MIKYLLLLLPIFPKAQSLKDYLPSIVCTLLAGSSDGLRDASMYRMDGRNDWWNGKHSWNNKYRNKDKTQGPAFFGSTNIFVSLTDAPHAANLFTHQFTGMALAFMPEDQNKKFGHVFLKVLSYNLVRQIGHTIVYEGIFRSRK